MIKDPICVRTLKADSGGSTARMIVRLAAPRKRGKSWLCDFHITGIGLAKPISASGEDSFQALQMALEGIRIHLNRSHVSATWIGGDVADHGFPKLLIAGGITHLRARIEAMAEREEAKYWKSQAKGH